MNASFWHERWEKNQLGFHNHEVNAFFARHWPELGLDTDGPVFVPLCGKSLDMRWLHERGHPILGVELSAIAARDFFEEAGLEPVRRPVGAFESWSAKGIEIRVGDVFDVDEEDLRGVRGCYDRGALVALPPELRKRYADHMIRVLPERVTTLMISVEYDQSRMPGPPHSVPLPEIEALFGGSFEIDLLELTPWRDARSPFRERGLDTLREVVVRLDRGGRP